MPSTVLHYQGHTYEIVLSAQSWAEASAIARNAGGYLAQITSAAENTAVFRLARAHYDAVDSIYVAPDGGGGSYVWIGGTDSAVEGRWRWSDGSAITGYSNWGGNGSIQEPDNYNGIQDHLGLSLDGWPSPSSSIGSAGQWNDINGNNGLWSVIEWDGLIGSNAADRITGTALSEEFFGGLGNDTLTGAGGNDTIDGGAGADRMIGGTGNDSYTVDNSRDVIVEAAGQGTDLVRSSVSLTLAANVENLILTGKAHLNGTGNGLANAMTGNGGNNTLSGMAGHDKLNGGAGNDLLDGGTGNDVLLGGIGTDRLIGGIGKDVLTGGAAADVFIFRAASDSTVAVTGRDVITDFSIAQHDVIDLRSIDANSTLAGNQAFTFIGAGAFTGVAGQLAARAVAGGVLVSGDLNGDRTADFAILIDDPIRLNANHFLL